jgi:hypothetical protein
MIKCKETFLFLILIFLGCKQEHPKEKMLAYKSEQEKLLNEVFLKIIGTNLYYKIEKGHLDEALKVASEKGEEAGRKVYNKYKEEDPARLVIFIKEKFIPIYKDTTDTLNSEILASIKERLIENKFIENEKSLKNILDSLSLPLKISQINLRNTGRYELIKEENKKVVKGIYKANRTFNCSRIYIDNVKKQACLFYETNCLEGGKCAAGTLVLLNNKDNKWKVIKEITIYQT